MRETPLPSFDLTRNWERVRDETLAAINVVLDSQHFILGPEVEALEKNLAAYLGTAHTVGCASGTDALLLALMALDLGPGDEVITTPFSFFATASGVTGWEPPPFLPMSCPIPTISTQKKCYGRSRRGRRP